MADDGKLYLDWELRGNVEKQIKETLKDAEKLQKALADAGEDVNNLDSSKMAKNLTKNVNDATKAIADLITLKEKADEVLARRADSGFNIDDEKLKGFVKQIDLIVERIMNIGPAAALSGNAVKNLMAELSFDIVKKGTKDQTRDITSKITAEEKRIAKEEKEAAKEAAAYAKEEEDAAARNLANQEKVKDALAKIATARSQLSAASQNASANEAAHAQLMLNLLDRLSQKLAKLKGQDLSEKGILDGVLGSGYQGLMRNVNTAIKNIGKQNEQLDQSEVYVKMSEDAERAAVRVGQLLKEITDTKQKIKELNDEEAKGVFRPKDKDTLNARLANLQKELDKNVAMLRQYGDVVAFINSQGQHLESTFGSAGDAAQRHAARQAELTETFNKYFEELEQKEKEEAEAKKKQTIAQEEFNKKLKENENIQKTLKKIRLDAESDKTIARIKGQRAQYDALGKKLLEIYNLIVKVEQESNGIAPNSGKLKYNREKVTEELEAIQRRYNEELAIGQEREKATAKSREKLSAASKKASEGTRNMINSNRQLLSTFKELEVAGKNTNRMISQMSTSLGTMFSFYGMKRLIENIITIGGQFEFQHMALQNILGDIQEANVLFAQLQGLAVESPKTFMELTSYAKQLSAYQIPASELYDTTKRLADMSTGLGVDMGRLILAYGQVRSAAVLRGQELRQFTEAGIPLVQKLADKFTELNGKITTTGDVFKLISARKVPFEMVRDVLWDMTDQGGQFYNMQGELADTLYGKWQKLQDTWQIMLGHLADGNSIMGGFMRNAVEGVVALTRSLDSLMPLLAWFGAGRMLRGTKNLIVQNYERISRTTDNAAINRLRVAKEQEVNNLLKRQLIYKEQINAADRAKLATANRIMSVEYQQLAAEGKISERKAYQLMLDGQLTKYHFKRLMLAKGYSKEQIQQIMQGRIQLLQQEQSIGSKIGSGILSFMGGWPGVIMTAIGGIVSIISLIREGDKELEMKGEAMMKHAQTNYNNIQKVLSSIDSESSVKKRIEALEDALIQTGRTGEAVVANSRNNMDDLNKRWEKLKEGAEEYNKVLESMAGEEGKALFTGAISESKIEDRLKDYDESTNTLYRQYATLSRFSEKYKEIINSMAAGNQKLAESLKGKTLFEQIDIVGADKIVKRLEEMSSGLRKNTPERSYLIQAAGALRTHLDYLGEVDDAWKKITDKSIPKMKDELLAAAESLNIKNFDSLTPKQKASLEALVREYVNGIQEGSVEAKNKLAEELAKQVFHIKIVGDLTIDKTKLTDFGNYVWTRFGGSVAGDKGKIKVGNNSYTKAQVSNIFGDLVEYKKTRNNELKAAREALATEKKLKDNAEGVKKAQEEVNNITSELVALDLLDEDKKKGGSGTKKDAFLEKWKSHISLLEKYRKELNDLEKYMTHTAAERKLRKDKNFDALFSYFNDPNDYKGSLGQAIDSLKKSGITSDRQKYIDDLNAKKGEEDLRVLKDNAKNASSELQRLLNIMSENYQIYKKWVELTGDEKLAARVAGVTENTSYAEYLKDLMKKELDKTNLALDPIDVLNLNEANVKKLGESTGIFDLWKAWQDNQKKLKKDSWDMFENSIKNAKDYKDEIDDLNRELKKTLENIDELTKSDTDGGARREKLRQSATDQTQEKINQKLFEQFKKDSDWNKIFEDLDNVTYETIVALIEKMKEFGAEATIDAKNTKEWVDAWNKLQEAAVNRNPFGAVMSIMSTRNEINSLLNGNKKQNSFTLSAEQASRFGLKVNRNDTYSRRELSDAAMKLTKQQGGAWTGLAKDFKALQDVLQPVIDLFDALGNSTLSDIFKAGNNALSSAANTAGAFSTLSKAATDAGMTGLGGILGKLGPYGAIASAALSVVSTAIGMFGADYSDYENMKAQYEGLIDVWDDLIDRKKEYLNESWGTEAKQAGKEALELYKAEIEETKAIAENRLGSGSSWGSRSIGYRMWEGSYKYNGKNWKDYASEISRALGGVKFESMYDMLNMTSEQLLWIKMNYAGLWANMDDDFKEYLEKLIKYGDEEKEILDDLQKKLTGMDYEEMVTNYSSALSEMKNENKALGENLEDTLKDAILNAMVANVYGERIKSLIEKTKELGENDDKVYENGKILSEYTADEYAIIKAEGDALNKDMEASRDRLKKMYGWTDDNGSESTNAIGKAITEQDTSLWSSYLNAIRLDVSVQRVTLEKILLEVQKGIDIPESVMSQLRNLENIAEYTRRNAEAAETISKLLKGVAPDGTYIKIK
jgi:hypothetical protein